MLSFRKWLKGRRPRFGMPRRLAQLEYRNALLAAEQEASPEGSVIVDHDSGRIVSCNHRFVEMWEVPAEIVDSRSLDRLIAHMLSRTAEPEKLRGLVRGARESPDEKVFAELPMNDGRILEVHAGPIAGAGGRRYGRATYWLDVTRRARAEALLRQKSEALARSNTDLDMFAYAAAHDLSAPLRRIIGFGDLLKDRLKDRLDPDSGELLARMQSSAANMSKLIADVLALARAGGERLPLEDADLNRLTADILAEMREALDEAGAAVEAGPLPTLRAHSSLLRRVLQNLLSNALKFRKRDEPLRVRVDSRVSNGAVEITVADNGIGFEQESAESVFEPFVRLQPAGDYPGSGIGLALCRRIAERYGGRISAASVPGKGTVFKLELPASMLAGGAP